MLIPGFTTGPRRTPRSSLTGGRDDWWGMAQRLASDGSFTDAAHALYLALITAASRRGLVAVHDSKTSGDYLRELRRNATAGNRRVTSAELSNWRDFVRLYDAVIYGLGACDAQQFASLQALAASALGAER